MIAGGDPDRANVAIALKADGIALGADYASFTQRWSGRNASDHWPGYRLSAIRMIRLIRKRLDYESGALSELLAG